MEEWKDIADYPGYQVSNFGRVRSHNKVTQSARFNRRVWKDRIIKGKIGKDNCTRVELWNGKKHDTVLVYRLEAVAFLGGSLDSKMTVNHKDGNRLNNNIENLEWVTRRENIQHGFNTGLYDALKKQCVLYNDTISYEFSSMAEASRFLGRKNGYISYCVKSKRKASDKDGNKYTIRF